MEIYFDGIKFLSPNEPITPYGVQRLLDQINTAIQILELKVGIGEKTITIWNPNISYQKGNVVLHFKQESKQVSPEIGKRDFVFLLVSLKNNNDSIPNYDLVDGIPNFTKSNWQLLNPMSYLLQDLI